MCCGSHAKSLWAVVLVDNRRDSPACAASSIMLQIIHNLIPRWGGGSYYGHFVQHLFNIQGIYLLTNPYMALVFDELFSLVVCVKHNTKKMKSSFC